MEKSIPKLIETSGGSTGNKVARIIEAHVSRIHTTTIGVIQSFDAENQTAVIQPAIKRVVGTSDRELISYTSEDYPLLVNVPVVFSGGGDWFLTFPVTKGDECLIFSMERSIGKWKKNGGVQDPSHFKRKLSFKDAVAMVGIQSKASSLPNFNIDEPEIRNRDGSVKLTMTDTGMTLTGDLTVKGEIKADSEVSANNATASVGLSTHVHPSGIAVSTTGTAIAQTGTTTAPTSSPTAGT